VRLRFIAPVLLAIAAAAAWYFISARDDRGDVPHRTLNVVLITIDTLRADRLGRGLTPNIDRLAARGVSYAGVRATVPLTLPSHVSLMTGAIPPVHGVRENGVVFDRKTPTLARVFSDAGYTTGAFVGAFVLNRRFGLAEGFETYDDEVRRDPARAERLEAERPAGEVVDAAAAWLQRQDGGGRPFFLWVHVYDPHAPYAPPADFERQSGKSGYDAEVAYVDAQIGRLLSTIDGQGLNDSTLVVLTSDHGESLGEHGEETHGMLLYDGALRVPLIVTGADVTRTSAAPCHQDVAALILDLSGQAARTPASMSRPGAREGEGAATIECAAYSETRYPRRAGWHALAALSDSRWKLIRSSEQELYDLSSDPSESQNVASAHPNVVNGMLAALTRLLPSRDNTAAVSADAAERLRALGYASGSPAATSDDPAAVNPARVIAAWTSFERALGLLQQDRATEAVRVLRPLTAQHPEAQVFQSTLGLALRESGDARGALTVYRAAVAKWASDPALFHDLAAAAREAGAADEALRAEQAALALDDSSAMAQNGLGLLHADAGRHAEAAAAFERATTLDQTNPSYWTNLGNARAAVRDAAAAETAYRRALDVDPEFADALNGLGSLYVQTARSADAVPLFERALRREPQFQEARLNLGIALQQSGQVERAAEVYREILATAPASAKREREAAAVLLKSVAGR
jgi:arylsulfatase A-like enzyme/Flp pilus assembly protein TadD